MNNLMKEEYLRLDNSIELNSKLKNLMNKDFLLKEDCFLLLNTNEKLNDFPTKTEYEYSVNEIYINEYDYKKDKFLSVGVKFIKLVLKKFLKVSNENLIACISLDLDEYPNMIIRFNIERELEEPVISKKDLNSFKINPILLMDSDEIKFNC